jgi:hypothetical protein
LGVAPSGTWMWMSRLSNISSLMPRRCARLRTTERAASGFDSPAALLDGLFEQPAGVFF